MELYQLSQNDFWWIIGWLEGEGCFQHNGHSPVISVTSTDRDTVEKFSELVLAPVYTYVARSTKHKDTYRVNIFGEKALALMTKILPHMSKRRKEKIESILEWSRKRTGRNGEKNSMSKLSNEEVKSILQKHLNGYSVRLLAFEYGLSERNMYRVVNRESYREAG